MVTDFIFLGFTSLQMVTAAMKLKVLTHQMVNTKIILIMFFAAKDGEALYSQQKQD